VRPLDRRLLHHGRPARVALAVDAALGLLATVLVLAQAVLFADIVSLAFGGHDLGAVGGSIVLFAAVVCARSVVAGAFESTGRRAGARVMSDLRLALVRGRLRDAPLAADGAEAGEVATAAVQGVDSLETYFARYLPQLVLAAIVPLIVLAWTFAVDPWSALIMLITLPLIPVFMVLIGRATQARTRERWRALARLSNHFLDVVRGLATLRAFNRGRAQAERLAATGEEYRTATMEVLRVSFLSGAVLDLLATLATALVAVTLGVRLIGGTVTLRDALIVLLLTPELYAPLRAMAAQFHASADGLAAAERILGLIDDGPAGGGARRLGGCSSLGRVGRVAGTGAAGAGWLRPGASPRRGRRPGGAERIRKEHRGQPAPRLSPARRRGHRRGRKERHGTRPGRLAASDRMAAAAAHAVQRIGARQHRDRRAVRDRSADPGRRRAGVRRRVRGRPAPRL
jgi:ABC-type multidrug transport system fused ATPase/permease subunit